ncbi:MAG: alcohol dehydrogenase catalytic domain-containing protein [Patulibacter sp.]|nr:alcohol dehydrogenase catalytic domain-containing protein [Patulibacter sp.]
MSQAQNSRWLLDAPRSFKLETGEERPLPPGWVRLHFLYCGICGSDMSEFEGRRALAYPRSLGHEFVAEIAVVGPGVEGFSPGDLVTSDLNHRCGECDQCRARRSHLCRTGQIGGFSNRGFAQSAEIDARYLLRIDYPRGPQLALTEPLSCVLHALDWAQLDASDRVLVIGAGGLGLCLAFALCAEFRELSFAIADTNVERLTRVAAAALTAAPVSLDAPTEYDVVFDLSGSESGLRAATERVIGGGRLCTMSHLDGYTTGEFLLGALTRKDVTFKVSYLNGEFENVARAMSLIADRWSSRWDATLETVPYDALPAAFARRRLSSASKTIVDIG